jgi:glucose-1-phosphate thymidylyltransferase
VTDELIGLVPAAGQGTRLGLPYPKELQPLIRGSSFKPVAQFAVESLAAAGVRHIVFVVNESKHQLMGYFGAGRRFGVTLSYVVQEPSPAPGLAGALDAAHHLVAGKTVLFAMPDTIVRPADAFAHLLGAAAPDDALVLGLFATNRPDKLGMVDVGQGGRVRAVVDKPRATTLTLAWGIMLWRPSFTEHLHRSVAGRGGDLAAIVNDAIAAGLGARGVVVPGGRFADLGTFDDIVATEDWYRKEDG